MSSPSLPESLVLHDGELGDVCALFDRLGLFFRERRGGALPEDAARRWDVVVATPRRMLEFRPHGVGSEPVRIAVLDRDTKTLRAMLQRAGIDLVVRRPVHPAALRLLVLHCLYRGPERRRSPRVSVGAPVRIRLGFRRRSAVLADLSLTGCRLLARQELERGARLAIHLPPEISGTRRFRVSGSVLRVSPSEMEGFHAIAVTFGTCSDRTRRRLLAVVEAHAQGPAVLEAGTAPALDEVRPDGLAGSTRAAAAPESAALQEERRGSPRRAYVQHVIALGTEAGRVLVGRDISLGGMRVDPHPDLRVGDALRIGLHLRAREKPLVLDARVARNDGAEGFVLQFRSLSAEAEGYLRSMVNFLPILAVRPPGEEDRGVILSEILDCDGPELG